MMSDVVDHVCYYHFLKVDVFPRVEYFQRLLRGLLPRFKRVLGYFDEFYIDKKRVLAIEHSVNMVLQPPDILVLSSNGQFTAERTAAAKSIFTQETYSVGDPNELWTKDHTMTLFVYHYQTKPELFQKEQFSQWLSLSMEKVHIQYKMGKSKQRDNETNPEHIHVLNGNTGPLTKLFIACDLSDEGIQTDTAGQILDHAPETSTSKTAERMESETNYDHLKEEVSEYLVKQHFGDVDLKAELIKEKLQFGEKVDLGVSISQYLESQVFLGFDNIDNFLRELRKHNPSCYNVAMTIHEDKRISELFVLLLQNSESMILSLEDLCAIAISQKMISLSNRSGKELGMKELKDTSKTSKGKAKLIASIDDENLFIIFVLFISQSLKGLTIQILYEKFSLSYILTHQCLEKFDFQEKVKSSLVNNEKLKSHISGTIQLAAQIHEKTSRNKNLYAEKMEALVETLTEGLHSMFSDLEKVVKQVDKNVETVKKMSFEISGYYKRTKLRADRSTPKVPFTKELYNELFKTEEVMGCGFVYNIFEVLIKEESDYESVKSTIDAVMKNHKHIGRYEVKMIQKPNNGFMTQKDNLSIKDNNLAMISVN